MHDDDDDPITGWDIFATLLVFAIGVAAGYVLRGAIFLDQLRFL